MECAISFFHNNSWAALALARPASFFFFIDTYLISVRSEMYVFIVKTWHFFVMNYFIMLAEAVIKCVLFYDNNVIEGGCNKSCPGLFLFFFFLFFFFRC